MEGAPAGTERADSGDPRAVEERRNRNPFFCIPQCRGSVSIGTRGIGRSGTRLRTLFFIGKYLGPTLRLTTRTRGEVVTTTTASAYNTLACLEPPGTFQIAFRVSHYITVRFGTAFRALLCSVCIVPPSSSFHRPQGFTAVCRVFACSAPALLSPPPSPPPILSLR
ncbi:hypothetical protein GW17_00009719 [Ensete ventricosum]|nr:hypothetical protein GW17_00009719 [Ensete ventricosum]